MERGNREVEKERGKEEKAGMKMWERKGKMRSIYCTEKTYICMKSHM